MGAEKTNVWLQLIDEMSGNSEEGCTSCNKKLKKGGELPKAQWGQSTKGLFSLFKPTPTPITSNKITGLTLKALDNKNPLSFAAINPGGGFKYPNIISSKTGMVDTKAALNHILSNSKGTEANVIIANLENYFGLKTIKNRNTTYTTGHLPDYLHIDEFNKAAKEGLINLESQIFNLGNIHLSGFSHPSLLEHGLGNINRGLEGLKVEYPRQKLFDDFRRRGGFNMGQFHGTQLGNENPQISTAGALEYYKDRLEYFKLKDQFRPPLSKVLPNIPGLKYPSSNRFKWASEDYGTVDWQQGFTDNKSLGSFYGDAWQRKYLGDNINNSLLLTNPNYLGRAEYDPDLGLNKIQLDEILNKQGYDLLGTQIERNNYNIKYYEQKIKDIHNKKVKYEKSIAKTNPQLIHYSNPEQFGHGYHPSTHKDLNHFNNERGVLMHSRLFTDMDNPNIGYIYESQSDYAQKLVNREVLNDAYGNQVGKHTEWQKQYLIDEKELKLKNMLEELEKNNNIIGRNENKKILKLKYGKFNAEIERLGKEIELLKVDFKNNPQKDLLNKNWWERLLQENTAHLANDGKKIIRVPTKDTAAKIQGYDVNASKYQAILKRYQNYGKTIKKEFGIDAEIITDQFGHTWWQFNIPDSFLKGKGVIKLNLGGSTDLKNFTQHYKEGGELPKAQYGMGQFVKKGLMYPIKTTNLSRGLNKFGNYPKIGDYMGRGVGLITTPSIQSNYLAQLGKSNEELTDDFNTYLANSYGEEHAPNFFIKGLNQRAMNSKVNNEDIYGSSRIIDKDGNPTYSIFEENSNYSPLDFASLNLNFNHKKGRYTTTEFPFLGTEPFDQTDAILNSPMMNVRKDLLIRMNTPEGRKRIKYNYIGKLEDGTYATEADIDKFITSVGQIPTLETEASRLGIQPTTRSGEFSFSPKYLQGVPQRQYAPHHWNKGEYVSGIEDGILPNINMNLNLPNNYLNNIYRHENEHMLNYMGKIFRDKNITVGGGLNPGEGYAKSVFSIKPIEFAIDPLNLLSNSAKQTMNSMLNRIGLGQERLVYKKNASSHLDSHVIQGGLLKSKGHIRYPLTQTGINKHTDGIATHFNNRDKSYVNTENTLGDGLTKEMMELEAKMNHNTHGTIVTEPLSHVAELQQFMMDNKLIPNQEYVEITEAMIKNVRDKWRDKNNQGLGYEGYPMRILDILEDTPPNNKIIAKVMNGLLGTVPIISGLASEEKEEEFKYGGELSKFQEGGSIKFEEFDSFGGSETSAYKNANDFIDYQDKLHRKIQILNNPKATADEKQLMNEEIKKLKSDYPHIAKMTFGEMHNYSRKIQEYSFAKVGEDGGKNIKSNSYYQQYMLPGTQLRKLSEGYPTFQNGVFYHGNNNKPYSVESTGDSMIEWKSQNELQKIYNRITALDPEIFINNKDLETQEDYYTFLENHFKEKKDDDVWRYLRDLKKGNKDYLQFIPSVKMSQELNAIRFLQNEKVTETEYVNPSTHKNGYDEDGSYIPAVETTGRNWTSPANIISPFEATDWIVEENLKAQQFRFLTSDDYNTGPNSFSKFAKKDNVEQEKIFKKDFGIKIMGLEGEDLEDWEKYEGSKHENPYFSQFYKAYVNQRNIKGILPVGGNIMSTGTTNIFGNTIEHDLDKAGVGENTEFVKDQREQAAVIRYHNTIGSKYDYIANPEWNYRQDRKNNWWENNIGKRWKSVNDYVQYDPTFSIGRGIGLGIGADVIKWAGSGIHDIATGENALINNAYQTPTSQNIWNVGLEAFSFTPVGRGFKLLSGFGKGLSKAKNFSNFVYKGAKHTPGGLSNKFTGGYNHVKDWNTFNKINKFDRVNPGFLQNRNITTWRSPNTNNTYNMSNINFMNPRINNPNNLLGKPGWTPRNLVKPFTSSGHINPLYTIGLYSTTFDNSPLDYFNLNPDNSSLTVPGDPNYTEQEIATPEKEKKKGGEINKKYHTSAKKYRRNARTVSN